MKHCKARQKTFSPLKVAVGRRSFPFSEGSFYRGYVKVRMGIYITFTKTQVWMCSWCQYYGVGGIYSPGACSSWNPGKALGPEVGDVELVIFSGQLVEAALKVVGFSMIFNPRAFEGYIHILEYLYMYICIYIYIAIYIDAYKLCISG